MLKKLMLLSITSLLCFPAHAVPNDKFKDAYSWLENHPYFPSSQIGGGGSSSMVYRELTEDRLLNFEVVYRDFETVPNYQNAPVDSEAVVIRSKCSKEPGFLWNFFQNLASHDKTCEFSDEFAPVSRSNDKLFKMMDIIYGKRSPIIKNDLKSSKLVYQGKRYFQYDPEDWRHTNKKMIKSGPLEHKFLLGNKYNYVLSPFGFVVFSKSSKHFQRLKNEVEKDQKLYNSVMKEIEQKKANLKKEQPLDF